MKKYFLPVLIVNFTILSAVSVSTESCTTKAKSADKVIDINNVTVNLPQAKGVDLVQQNCSSCHSLRYIEVQPNLTKPAWKKIVKKMVGTFGAPIKDTNDVNQIVDYLVSIKGKK